MTHMPHTTRSLQNGFSLIEALVALLVLSVGLLGLAGLQLLGMQSSHSAYQRTVASVIAADAGERLWIKLAEGGELTQADVQAVRDDWRDHWQHQAGTDADGNYPVSLPGMSDADITCENNNDDDNVCVISVRWAEGRFEELDDESRFDYRVRLPVDITDGNS
ncbi:type IV pilus modification protein PilV [Ectothiorhodospira variabilis]|uniref:type IV pilus modification protein PilV n=1 Tax=Ectothiorhodospira variabilis TaxID=505694 RepID=UPI001EFBFFBF|nr:type IV pilus modification protein PilV [Ectothiorhodospira variabilis]MCG5493557.1 type IV pilus modification protein PilV [Ectothiorhodospira variabilis]MCG5502886.1 type IV pilus modification protein PilV [Ectothiorhodospira variabilis]MCG5506326.1 type IV pilus modification protein PilV [Ectothiorhodospira variabilis]